VTAERGLLDDAAGRRRAKRTPREVAKGRQSGRTHEFSALIGRSLRTLSIWRGLGETSVMCGGLRRDQADGGTRTRRSGTLRGAGEAMAPAVVQWGAGRCENASPRATRCPGTSVGSCGGDAMDLDTKKTRTQMWT